MIKPKRPSTKQEEVPVLRYFIGKKSVPEALTNEAFSSHVIATKAATKIGDGAVVMSLSWAQRRGMDTRSLKPNFTKPASKKS
jgi:hypothetical protein